MALRRVRRSIGSLGKIKKRKVSGTGRYVVINGKAYPIVTVRKKNIKKKENDQVYGKSMFQ